MDAAQCQQPKIAMGPETKLHRLPLFRSRRDQVCGLSSCCFYSRPSKYGAEQLQTNNNLPTLIPPDVRCILSLSASWIMCSFSQIMHTRNQRRLLFTRSQSYLQTAWSVSIHNPMGDAALTRRADNIFTGVSPPISYLLS